MNLNKIFGAIETADAEVYDRMDTRRSAMKNFASMGGKIALAAVPLAFGSMFKKAYAGSTSTKDTAVEILNYALTLEYLEAEFYRLALASAGLVPGGVAMAAVQTIYKHEKGP